VDDRYDWDEQKRQANLRKHGVDFKAAAGFDWETALVLQDERFGCTEARSVAIGWLEGRLHLLVFQDRREHVRLISLRRTTPQEGRLYAAWARANQEGRDFP
jgi:hypothetical protein